MSSERTAYISLLRDNVARMASNSFLLKGWTITIVAAVFVLVDKDRAWWYHIALCFPVLFFWYLDAYYLKLERQYRELCDYVVAEKSNGGSPIALFTFKIPDDILRDSSFSLWNVFWSKTLKYFYIPCILLVVLFAFLSLGHHKKIEVPTKHYATYNNCSITIDRFIQNDLVSSKRHGENTTSTRTDVSP